GFGKRLGLAGQTIWQATWSLLDRLIEDGDDNGNNRFDCAGQLNTMGGRDDFPFWGHPHGHDYAGLGAKKCRDFGEALAERRLVESRLPRTKTVWQLYGNGSVGGQCLVGIPRLMALCADQRLAGRAHVWPFETAGLRVKAGDIVVAEVYPSLVEPVPEPGFVKDATQVRSIANFLARADDDGRLAGMIALDDILAPAEETAVRSQEGWILGVQGAA
ncbi:MAG: cobalamin biosynthesis protein CbiG, partial [Alphaproteobacteria bacterium]